MLKLAVIANNIQKQSRPLSNSVIGVVTDITRPLYRQKQGNYIVMIKIVDQSLNDQQLFGVMSKDCSVYLISKKKEEIDFIKAIGQIVLLDKFLFVLWNDIKLETKYLGTTQGIYVVTFDETTNQLVKKHKLTMNPQLLDVNQMMIERVKSLMEWRSTYLPKIYQPKLGVNILNSHCVMIEPFNMILRYEGKIHEQVLFNQQMQYTLLLKDLNNNSYKIKHNSQQFEPGDLLFIRSISSIAPSLQLILTQTGNILRFAYSVNPNVMNYMAIHRDNQKFITNQKQNQFTSISCQSNDLVYIKQLVQLQDRYKHTNRKQEVDVRDSYIISGIVINFQGQISMYHREFQILLHDGFYEDLSEEDKKEYQDLNKISYVYEGVIGIIDRSIESKGKPFYVHLFNSDPFGNFINVQQFEKAEKAIGTPYQNIKRKQLLNTINKKLTKLSTESTFLKPVTLVLQPIRSEKLLFRVVSTKII